MGALCITRKAGQSVLIGDDVTVRVTHLGRGQCKLEITAPPEFRIIRAELEENHFAAAFKASFTSASSLPRPKTQDPRPLPRHYGTIFARGCPADPKTDKQWREAVDAAEACLLLHAAQNYGLARGGPSVDSARCLDLLIRGRQIGVAPDRAAVDRRFSEFGIGEGARRAERS